MMIVNEKIGIYTEDEILEHLTEGEGRSFLGRSMYDAIFDKIHALKTENEQLKQENKQLKENNMSMQEEMARTWEKADLYKEVIDEVRKFIEDWLFDAGGNGASMTYEDINELLQILDKVKG